MKRPITIASGQFGDLSLEELCKLVSSIGYEGIEIACQAHINVHKVLVMTPMWRSSAPRWKNTG